MVIGNLEEQSSILIENGKCKMENCFFNTLKIFNFQFSIFNSRVAFTLAEVLITLGIIGVVAALTMPMLITNINERIYSERHANIAYKVTQAMEQMRAHGKLVQYSSTDAFVDELQKYLKIQKRCSASNIADCWSTEYITDGHNSRYKVSNAKKRKDLFANTTTGDLEDNNVGLILADGASLILTYDNSKEGKDIGDKIEAKNVIFSIGKGKTKEFAYTTNITDSIDFITDVNGKKVPNKEGRDIKSFSSATFTRPGHPCDDGPEGCLYIVPTYSSINCCPSQSGTDEYQRFCGSGYVWSEYCSNDAYAGARKACYEAGMELASTSKLQAIYAVKSSYIGSLAPLSSYNDWFRSNDEYSGAPQYGSNAVYFKNGNVYAYQYKHDHLRALCVKN